MKLNLPIEASIDGLINKNPIQPVLSFTAFVTRGCTEVDIVLTKSFMLGNIRTQPIQKKISQNTENRLIAKTLIERNENVSPGDVVMGNKF